MPENETAAAVVFEHLDVSLGGVRILEEVGASVPAGGWTAVVGPNGAGKTTLLLALLGEIPYAGRIRRASGGDLRLGYVPQRLAFDRGLPLTVTEFLAMGIQRRPLWLGVRREAHEQALEALEWVRAGQLARRRLGALSGGELQRVLLALAVLRKPELLVLDEPAAGVDIHGGVVFCELLDTLRRERGFTLLMVSHDLSMITHHATHVVCLNRRVIAEGAPREVLNRENLTALFGMHMGLVDAHAVTTQGGACSCNGCREEKHD